MRIKSISINRLFNLFNYSISMNLKDRITIIHAPNGYGKTTILKLIDTLFKGQVNEFKNAPLKFFSIEFESGEVLSIDTSPLLFRLTDPKQPGVVKEFKPELSVEAIKNFLAYSKYGAIEREIPTLRRIGPARWLEYPTGRELTLEEVIDNYSNLLPPEITQAARIPDWFTNFISQLQVRFISSGRLLQHGGAHKNEERVGIKDTFFMPNSSDVMQGSLNAVHNQPSQLLPAVLLYSNELTRVIEEKLTEYAIMSQELDRTLPERLLAPVDKGEIYTEQFIEEKLRQIELRRGRLEAIGILTKKVSSPSIPVASINENTRRILTLYIQDTEKKLDIFNELQEKINFLKEMINRRFLYKTFSISREKGFVFTRADGALIPLDKLSSGEQHELVLLYELLFRTKGGSLILIDEPELSLHIMWQEQFLSDLQEISNLTDVDILIATHSPQIIHDRWDLAIELKGEEREENHSEGERVNSEINGK